MVTLGFIVAPPSQRSILQTLIDLSVAGVISPFGWIEDATVAPNADINTTVLWVDEGSIQLRDFQEIAQTPRLELIRLGVLVPAGLNNNDALDAQRETLYRQVAQLDSDATYQFHRIVVPWNACGDTPALRRDGWLNWVLSPEETLDPGNLGTPWWDTPEKIPGAASISIATILGLVASCPNSPADDYDANQANMGPLRAIRTFARLVNATKVENSLRKQTITTKDDFPRPYIDNTNNRMLYFPDPAKVCRQSVDSVLERWEHLFTSEELIPRRNPPATIGGWEALKRFFQFLWAALKNAPAVWMNQIAAEIAGGIANRIQDLYGHDANYQIVVKGVAANVRCADSQSIARAANDLRWTMYNNRPQEPPETYAGMCEDMVATAFALLDGGSADGQRPEYMNVGQNPGVIQHLEHIAPGLAAGGTFVVNQYLGHLAPGVSVEAWDHLRIKWLSDELEAVQAPAQAAAEIERMQLDAWQADYRASYLSYFGKRLSGYFDDALRRIRDNLEILNDSTPNVRDHGLEARQHFFGKTLQWSTISTLLVTLVTGTLLVFSFIAWPVFWMVSLTSGAMMLASWVYSYVILQQDIFKILHKRRETENTRETAAHNLEMAFDDLRRSFDAYEQFHVWARLLTSFLKDPLGVDAMTPLVAQKDVDLPLSLQRATAVSTPQSITDCATKLRRRTFTRNWLSHAWTEFEGTIKDYVDQATAAEINDVFGAVGVNENALQNWLAGVNREGVVSQTGLKWWNKRLDELNHHPELQPELVINPDDRHFPNMPVADYTAPLDLQPEAPNEPHRLVPDLFTAQANARDKDQVNTTWPRAWNIGLSSTLLLVEMTDLLTDTDFDFACNDPEIDEKGLPPMELEAIEDDLDDIGDDF